MTTLFFVHIPKTAGTSLNKAAEAQLGSNAVEKDYGADSTATSALVQNHIYGPEGEGAFALTQALQAANTQWLTGHVFAERYVHLLGAENTIAFVRDPIERVISEYWHRVHHFGLKRDFTDFYRDPAETNKQFRMIGQLAWQAMHLVGDQHQYNACLSLLNTTKKLSLQPLRTNISKQPTRAEISAETRHDIQKWNERDCIFVAEVQHYLAKQFAAQTAGQPFCFHDMGFVPDTHIIGWAFYQNNENPVEVGLYVDGILVETTRAQEHRAELQCLLTPRAGHNGFRFVLAQYASAQSVLIKALNTDQTLFEWQREG